MKKPIKTMKKPIKTEKTMVFSTFHEKTWFLVFSGKKPKKPPTLVPTPMRFKTDAPFVWAATPSIISRRFFLL